MNLVHNYLPTPVRLTGDLLHSKASTLPLGYRGGCSFSNDVLVNIHVNLLQIYLKLKTIFFGMKCL